MSDDLRKAAEEVMDSLRESDGWVLRFDNDLDRQYITRFHKALGALTRALDAARSAPPPAGETVRVRIAVAQDADGERYYREVRGESDDGEAFATLVDFADADRRLAILTADIPLPRTPEARATVEQSE